ncbi:MAG TPA: hypothetical protein VNO81_08145 [Candidatus Nitrosotenuis sp.]|nr:hypothetical protein [Candidatus Nitrosotenuis sp.]
MEAKAAGLMHQISLDYALRNRPDQVFHIQAEGRGEGSSGAVVRARITGPGGADFRYEVVFTGEFAASKGNFTEEMYLQTGVALVKSQIESCVWRDSRITVSRNSGLAVTEVGAALDGRS